MNPSLSACLAVKMHRTFFLEKTIDRGNVLLIPINEAENFKHSSQYPFISITDS